MDINKFNSILLDNKLRNLSANNSEEFWIHLIKNRSISNTVDSILKLESEKRDILKKGLEDLVKKIKKYYRTSHIDKFLEYIDLANSPNNSKDFFIFLKSKIINYNDLIEFNFEQVLNDIEVFGEKIIILKGNTFKKVYPLEIIRDCVDIDIYTIDNQTAIEITRSLTLKNWQIDKLHINPTIVGYALEFRLINIENPFIVVEVHNNITSISGNTYLKTNLWEDLVKIEYSNKQFYSSNETNTIIFLLAHILHHGHFKYRDLFDFYFYINENRERINYKKLQDELYKNKLNLILYKILEEIKRQIDSDFYFEPIIKDISFLENKMINILYDKSSEFSLLGEVPFRIYYFLKFHQNIFKALKSIKGEFKRLFEYLLYFMYKKKGYVITSLIWNLSSLILFKRKKLALNGEIPKYSRSIFEQINLTKSKLKFEETVLCEGMSIETFNKKSYLKTEIGYFKFLNFNNENMFEDTNNAVSGISIKNVSKVYPKNIYANKDINLHLEKGKVIGLIGANGSGKTTLINLILGRLSVSTGYILIDSITSKNYLKANTISYIPQEFGLYEFLTVEEHIKYFASIHDYKFNENLFFELGLDKLRQKKIFNLSGGEKKRVLLALALMPNPNILIIDELTANVDYNWRWKIIEILNTYKKQNPDCLILYTSHNLDEVEAFSDKIVLLDKGSVLKYDWTNQLLSEISSFCKYSVNQSQIDEINIDFPKHIKNNFGKIDVLFKDIYENIFIEKITKSKITYSKESLTIEDYLLLNS
jgi:ABC-2 type transport system ATP-binding protein